jgi:hypothetical protein
MASIVVRHRASHVVAALINPSCKIHLGIKVISDLELMTR